MKFQGAVIKEQGVTFALIVVKKQVVDSKGEADRMIQSLKSAFGGIPVVLMAQNTRGTPTYYGRGDIVKFMSRVPLRAIPWRQYSLN